MARVQYQKDKYLQRQRISFMFAQETVFPDKRELRKALDCSYSMYKNYACGLVPLPDILLYNKAIEDSRMAEFSQVYIKHLWGVDG